MKRRLSALSTVRVDEELFRYTHETLREYSSSDVEAMALWAGRFSTDQVFDVLAVKIPAQRALRTESGLAVIIDADELHRLNVWLFREGFQLVAQLHTHPNAAYHSDMDDAIPIVAARGGLSLVIPDFARGATDLETYAVYRLGPGDTWDAVDDQSVSDVVRVIPSGAEV